MRNCFFVLSVWIFTLGFQISGYAQTGTNQHFLLQTKANYNQRQLELDLKQKFGFTIPVIEIEKGWGLYQANIPQNSINSQIQFSLENSDGIQWIRPAQKLTKRRLPNDSLLKNQYQPYQLGLFDVWYNSIGGLNRRGDTVYIAVIDDGVDTAHPDLKPNLFRNWKEIPFNGKDDDGNGYVDDYQGWNGGDRSPYVHYAKTLVDGHGTEVTGVVAAVGNNLTGITGVNWITKFIPVPCYPTSDTVDALGGLFRSLLYIYRNKKLYLESGHKKGFNIVTLTMSVGMDNAFPSDAPWWCQLYDSLGSVGIVSVSAATNANVDVGKTGDMPTLCPSKFLVTVSSSDIMNDHAPSGYNDSLVDISAPGEGSFTTFINYLGKSGYKYESGTSFAAPLVAGTMTLIHTAACTKFLDLCIVNFDSAMGLYRQWMLKGALKLPAFTKLNAANGRLSAKGMWLEMDSWCTKHDSFYTNSREFARSKMRIFPNPSDGHFFIISGDEGAGILEITDQLGRLVHRKEVFGNKIDCQFNLVEGIYGVKLRQGRFVFRDKITIH